MNCREVQNLLHAYSDGELDLTSSLEIERHCQDCPDCAPFHKNLVTLRTALKLKSPDLYQPAPSHLRSKIETALRQEARSSALNSNTNSNLKWVKWGGRSRWLYAGLGAVTAVAALLLLALLPMFHLRGGDNTDLSREVVACHVRSLMVNHLTDVASTDRHTVKPWFNGKLDYAPPVIDLRAKGFPLIGGRLDYLDERPVTVMIYTRQKHTLNLFVWPTKRSSIPSQPEPSKLQPTTRQGYHLCHWTQADLQYWAISDLNTTELAEFAHLIQGANKSS